MLFSVLSSRSVGIANIARRKLFCLVPIARSSFQTVQSECLSVIPFKVELKVNIPLRRANRIACCLNAVNI